MLTTLKPTREGGEIWDDWPRRAELQVLCLFCRGNCQEARATLPPHIPYKTWPTTKHQSSTFDTQKITNPRTQQNIEHLLPKLWKATGYHRQSRRAMQEGRRSASARTADSAAIACLGGSPTSVTPSQPVVVRTRPISPVGDASSLNHPPFAHFRANFVASRCWCCSCP